MGLIALGKKNGVYKGHRPSKPSTISPNTTINRSFKAFPDQSSISLFIRILLIRGPLHFSPFAWLWSF